MNRVYKYNLSTCLNIFISFIFKDTVRYMEQITLMHFVWFFHFVIEFSCIFRRWYRNLPKSLFCWPWSDIFLTIPVILRSIHNTQFLHKESGIENKPPLIFLLLAKVLVDSIWAENCEIWIVGRQKKFDNWVSRSRGFFHFEYTR